MNKLDEKIILLHEYLYSHDKSNMKLGMIDIDNINIKDIKISYNTSEEYNDMVVDIFTGKFSKIFLVKIQ